MLIQLRRYWVNTSGKRGQLSTNADQAAAYAAAHRFAGSAAKLLHVLGWCPSKPANRVLSIITYSLEAGRL
jgi:hypothetical protein